MERGGIRLIHCVTDVELISQPDDDRKASRHDKGAAMRPRSGRSSPNISRQRRLPRPSGSLNKGSKRVGDIGEVTDAAVTRLNVLDGRARFVQRLGSPQVPR